MLVRPAHASPQPTAAAPQQSATRLTAVLDGQMYEADLVQSTCSKGPVPPGWWAQVDTCVGSKSRLYPDFAVPITIAGVEAGVWGNVADPNANHLTVVTKGCIPVGMGNGQDLGVFFNITAPGPDSFTLPTFCNTDTVSEMAPGSHPRTMMNGGMFPAVPFV